MHALRLPKPHRRIGAAQHLQANIALKTVVLACLTARQSPVHLRSPAGPRHDARRSHEPPNTPGRLERASLSCPSFLAEGRDARR